MSSLKDQFHTYVPRFVTNPTLANKLSQDAEKYPLIKSPEGRQFQGYCTSLTMPAPWTKASESTSGEQLPQIIAHRGYRSKYPENTMLAFQSAVSAGAHGLETDLHLTKDNVVVLSHDPSLKRCFGKDQLVADCEWELIQSLRTTAEPREPMPKLTELLKYLAQPEQEDIWLLLDIKMNDDPDLMIKSIASAIAAVPASPSRPWPRRIVLGIWAVKYLTPCAAHLPEFPISNIGFSTVYAKRFMEPKTPHVTFNMLYWSLMMPILGPRFITDAKRKGRAVYAWTVNDEQVMKWCMKHKVDAIITDDVEKLVNVRSAWEGGSRDIKIPIRQRIFTFWIWLLTTLLAVSIRRRLDSRSGFDKKRRS